MSRREIPALLFSFFWSNVNDDNMGKFITHRLARELASLTDRYFGMKSTLNAQVDFVGTTLGQPSRVIAPDAHQPAWFISWLVIIGTRVAFICLTLFTVAGESNFFCLEYLFSLAIYPLVL
jgi:hypothetical protein